MAAIVVDIQKQPLMGLGCLSLAFFGHPSLWLSIPAWDEGLQLVSGRMEPEA